MINEKVTSNKTKYVLVENELNELSKKVEPISTKWLTKDLINIIFLMTQNCFFRNITKLFSIYSSYNIF